jgi:hypothetical protein
VSQNVMRPFRQAGHLPEVRNDVVVVVTVLWKPRPQIGAILIRLREATTRSLLDEELPFRELEPRFKAFMKRFRRRDPRLNLER